MDYIGKGEMFTNRDVKIFVHNIERNKLFVHMEHFRDVLFQFMKHGTNTSHAAFIFLFSLYKTTVANVYGCISDTFVYI